MAKGRPALPPFGFGFEGQFQLIYSFELCCDTFNQSIKTFSKRATSAGRTEKKIRTISLYLMFFRCHRLQEQSIAPSRPRSRYNSGLNYPFAFKLFISGQSNLSNMTISPTVAALTLGAALLFAIVCIVLAAIYRRQTNR